MKTGVLLRLLATLASVIVIAPLCALIMKVSWQEFFHGFTNYEALKLSFWTSLLATAIALILGVPLAWIFAKGSKKITAIIRPLILAPIVLPPTVMGVALLALMGRQGLLGEPIFKLTGWSMPFTTSAVVLTSIFVGLPFVVLICESNFRQLPKEIEDAALIDRISGRQLFQKIAIPQSRSAITTAGLLAWARSIGEFGATLMFAGSLPGTSQTLSMFIYQQMDVDIEVAYSYALVMLIISIFVVYILRRPLQEAFR